MATLPASSDATGSTATEGQVKTWLAAVRTYIAQQLGANGTQIESLQTLGVPFNGAVLKTGAYTVVAADRGKVIRCTGTWTLSVTAVATLADGFVFAVLNEGSGTITVDPNLTEQVDGATTKALTAGSFTVFYCDGVKLKSMGSIDSAAVIAALGFTPANSAVIDQFVYGGAVGNVVCCERALLTSGLTEPTVGSTYAPYSTSAFRFGGTTNWYVKGGVSVSGNWRVLFESTTQYEDNSSNMYYGAAALLQRVS